MAGSWRVRGLRDLPSRLLLAIRRVWSNKCLGRLLKCIRWCESSVSEEDRRRLRTLNGGKLASQGTKRLAKPLIAGASVGLG